MTKKKTIAAVILTCISAACAAIFGATFAPKSEALAAGTNAAVYIGGTGASDSNSGTAAASPVASFAKAKQLLGVGGYIYVVGEVSVTNAQSWSLPLAEYGNAKILRDSSYGGALISVANGGALTLTDVTVDGAWEENDDRENTGALVAVSGTGKLTLESGARLQYNNVTGNGGAITTAGTATVTINAGAAIQYNYAANGAGIYAGGGTVKLAGGEITNNSATNGAGLYVTAGTVELNGNVSNNTATAAAGALYIDAGSAAVKITGSDISENTANYGGAIYANASYAPAAAVEIADTTFQNNTALSTAGGAINSASAAAINISGSVFNGNVANYGGTAAEGGAIYVSGASAITIENAKFTNNRAWYYGGAIRINNANASFTLNGTTTNALFEGNKTNRNTNSSSSEARGIDLDLNCLNAEIKGYTFKNTRDSAPYYSTTRDPNHTSVASYYGTTVIDGCSFMGTNAWYAIYILGSSQLTLKGSTVYGFRNGLYNGGVVIRNSTNTYKNHVIENCKIGKDSPANDDEKNVYGIRWEGSSSTTLTVRNSTIQNSTSGGVIFTHGGLVLADAVVKGNKGVGIETTSASGFVAISGAKTNISGNLAHSGTLSGDIRFPVGGYIRADGVIGSTPVVFSQNGALGAGSASNAVRIPSSIADGEVDKYKYAGSSGTSSYEAKFGITRSEAVSGNTKQYTYKGSLREKLSNVYISASGSDTTGDGNINNPYQTLTEALKWVSNTSAPVITLKSNITVNYEVTLTNCTIYGNYYFTVPAGGKVTINGNYNHIRTGTGVPIAMYITGGTVDLNCHLNIGSPNEYEMNIGTNSMVQVSGGTFNMNSGAGLCFSEYRNTATWGYSDGYYLLNVSGGTVNIKDGAELQPNQSIYTRYTNCYGMPWGGVRITGGTVNMSGGSWTTYNGSSSRSYSLYGVYLNGASAVFNLTGGKFTTEYQSNYSNAAVWVNNGTFNMSGGEITNNYASADGLASGVRIGANGKVNLSGSAKITTGTRTGAIAIASSGVGDSAKIHINGNLSADAKIDLFPNVDKAGGIIVKNNGNYSAVKSNFTMQGVAAENWILTAAKDVQVGGVQFAEVYVSAQGNDSNFGNIAAPVRTLSKALELVDKGGTIWILKNGAIGSSQIDFTLSANEVVDGTSKIADNGTRVKIKPASNFPTAHYMLYVNSSYSLSIKNIDFDGNGTQTMIGVYGNASLTIENSDFTNFKLTATSSHYYTLYSYTVYNSSGSYSYYYKYAPYGILHVGVGESVQTTLKNVNFKNNTAVAGLSSTAYPSLITAERFNTLNLDGVTFENNYTNYSNSHDIYIVHRNDQTQYPCNFNLSGLIKTEKGIYFDGQTTPYVCKTINIAGNMNAASVVKIKNWMINETDIVVKKSGSYTAEATSFSLVFPKFDFKNFNSDGELRIEETLYKFNSVWLDQTHGSDSNAGNTIDAPVKTMAQALSILAEKGTIYIKSTYVSVGTMLSKEVLRGASNTNKLNFAPSSGFTGVMFRIENNGYTSLTNVNIKGNAQAIDVQAGGTLRVMDGVSFTGFTGSSAVNAAGHVILKSNIDISGISLAANGALFTVSGSGALDITSGTHTAAGNKYVFANVTGGTANFNGGSFTGFKTAVNVAGGTANFVGSPSFTGNETILKVSSGTANIYGGTFTGSTAAPVNISGGAVIMNGGTVSAGEAASAVTLSGGSFTVNSGATVTAKSGGYAISSTAGEITLSGTPAIGGTIATKSALNAASYTGDLLSICRTDTITSKVTVIVKGKGDPEKFRLVNSDGEVSNFAIALSEGNLVAFSRFTAEFDLNGGKYNGTEIAPANKTYNDGDKFGELPSAMTKQGYTFGGWKIDGEGEALTKDSIISADSTLVAYWVPAEVGYKIHYFFENAENASYAFDSTKDANMKGLTESVATLPTGYETQFDGFTFNPDHTGNSYQNIEIAADGSTALNLYYKRNVYEIVVNLNDGTENATETISAKYGAKVTAPSPTRKGYTFGGFYTDGTFATEYTFSTMPLNGCTVQVKWNANTYTLSFALTGGSYSDGTLSAITVTYDQPISGLVTDETKFSKTGYEFQGWAVDGVKIDNGLTWTFDENKSANAQWKPQGEAEYKVEHYVENTVGVFELTETDIRYGVPDSAATYDANIYTGCTLDLKAEGSVTTGDVKGDGSLVLKIYYTRNKHKVTFNVLGGSAVAEQTVRYGAFVQTAESTRKGYTLEGWYAGSNSETLWVFGTNTMPDNDLKLNAKWRAHTYTVNFSGNGSDGGTQVQPMQLTYDGGLVAVRPNTFTHTGYTFANWNTAADGKGTTYAADAKLQNLTDVDGGVITFYAIWKANKYTVSFRGNDASATGTMADMSFEYGTAQSLTTNGFTKVGYTFDGWALTSTGAKVYSNGQSVNNLTAEDGGNVILFAKWKPSTNTPYKVSYYFQNIENKLYTKGTTLDRVGTTGETVSFEPLTQTGFDCNAARSVLSGTVAADGTLELKVYYDRKTFTITFDVDGKKTTVNYLFEAPTAPIRTPVKAGYTFEQWLTTDSTEYVFDKMPAENVELTATWRQNKYTIEFDGNGSTSGATDAMQVTYDASATTTLRANGFSRTGYTFAGWNTAVNGSGTGYAAGATLPNNLVAEDGGKYVLYAQWTVLRYTATFDAGAGSPKPSNQTVDFGGYLDIPADPARKGYRFTGWYRGETLWDFAADSMPAENITLTAKYDVITYVITYYLNGGTSSTSLPSTYTVETNTITLPAGSAMTKAHNTFREWRLESIETGTVITQINKGSTGNLAIYAVWIPAANTISFETYGGTAIESICGTAGQTIARPANPARPGYTFGGWYKSMADFKPDWLATWDFATDTIPASGTVLHAKWNPIEYTITYELAGGSWTGENPYPAAYTADTPTIRFNSNTIPVREGYTFLGFNPSSIERGTYGNQTVTAQWRVNVYTVSFESNGGTEIANQRVSFGAFVTRPSDPVKTGSTFGGWFKEEACTNEWNFATDGMAAGNMTLYAKWIDTTFTVIFDTAGGTATPTQRVEFGNAVTKPVDPERAGYTFGGWFKDDTLTESWNFASDKMPAGNLTLYAKWNVITYTITYDLAGGSLSGGNLNPVTYTVEDAFEIFGTPVKTGYDFGGWSPAKIEAGTTGNLTVTAQWSAARYALSFDLNGASGAVDPIFVTYGKAVGALSRPVRIGYAFEGWFNGSAKITEDTVWNYLQDVTLTAKWTAQDVGYTVNYYQENANDGEYTLTLTDTVKANTDTTATVTGHLNKYPNFTFNAELSTISAKVRGDGRTVLNVYYTRNIFNVTFDANGGSAVEAYKNVKHGATISAPAAPKKSGYTFEGWLKDGAAFTFGTMPAENLKLTAKWELVRYTVAYETNGGTISGTPITSFNVQDGTITLPATVTRTNYIFLGWYSNESWVGEKVTSFEASIAQDVTFYAGWTVGPDTIGFNSNGGTPVDAIKKTPGSPIEKPADPTKLGYVFGGWYEDNGSFIMPFKFEVMPASSLMLYAKWTAIEYTVKFDANGGTGTMPNASMRYGADAQLAFSQFIKTGYTFVGWNTKADGTGVSYEDGAVVKNLTSTAGATITLYAQWTANDYFVQFNKNSGSATGSMNIQPFRYGAEGTLTVNAFIRPGYTFLGWALTSDATIVAYVDGAQVINLTADGNGVVQLYAVWQANSYTLSFDVMGGEGTANDKTVAFDGAVGTLPTLTKTGYIFGGWTIDGATVTADTVWRFETNRTAVAVWAARGDIKYTIEYLQQNVNNDGYTVKDTILRYGTTDSNVVLSVGDYDNDRYAGFYFNSEKGLVNGSIKADGSLVLQVYYDRNRVTVRYADADGTTRVLAENVKFGSSLTEPSKTRTGYTFVRWYDGATGSTFVFADGAPATDMLLNAEWRAHNYRLAFDANGGTGSMFAIEMTYDGAMQALPVNAFTRTGYTFAGWNTKADGTGDAYGANAHVRNLTAADNGTVTLYAQWNGLSFTLTLTDADGVFDQISVVYGSKIGSALRTPTKLGYTFVNWMMDGSAITADTEWNQLGNKSASAQWTATKFTITYNSPVTGYSGDNPQDYTFDDKLINLVDASKAGYTFHGWFEEASFTTRITSFATDTEGKTVYAKWTLDNPTVTITNDAANVTYDANKTYTLTANVVHAAASELTYTYVWYKDGKVIDGATGASITVANVADSATYKVKVTATGSTLTSGTVEATTSVSIARADIPLQVTLDGWTYGDAAKTPKVTGNSGNGTVTYEYVGVDGTSYTGGSAVPVNAGSYKLKISVPQTADYNANTAEVEFTIAQRGLTVTVDGGLSSDYGKAIETITYTVEGTLAYDHTEAQVFTLGTSATNVSVVGKYDVELTVNNGNYDITLKNGTEAYEITPATITSVVINGYTADYDKSAHDAALTGYGATTANGQSAKWTFRLGDSGEFTEAVPTVTDAGTYTLYYKINAANHAEYADSVTVKVDKAKVTVPAIASKEYTGEALIADVTETELYGITENAGGVSIGGYDVVLTLKDSSNYKWPDSEDAEKTLVFSIIKVKNGWTTEPAIKGWTYLQTASEPTAAARFGNAVFTYKQGSTVLSGRPVNAGNYTLTVTVAETDNYTGLTKDVPFTVAKAKYDISKISFEDASFEDDGEMHSITLTGVLPEGLTVTYEGNGRDGAGEYEVTAKFSGDWDNYEFVEDMTAKLTIITPAWIIGGLSGGGALILALGITFIVLLVKKRKGGKNE